MTKKILSDSLNFEYWRLFVIWCLVFGAQPKPLFN
jgi:hypothetical protein